TLRERSLRTGNGTDGRIQIGIQPMAGVILLTQDLLDRTVAFLDQSHGAAEDLKLHLGIVESQLMQNGGVNIAIVVTVFDGFEAEFVGGSVNRAPFDASSGKPDRVAARVVITACRVL